MKTFLTYCSYHRSPVYLYLTLNQKYESIYYRYEYHELIISNRRLKMADMKKIENNMNFIEEAFVASGEAAAKLSQTDVTVSVAHAIEVELLRHYVNREGTVVRIRGEVEPGTIEYEYGAHFYDCEKRLYNEKGQCLFDEYKNNIWRNNDQTHSLDIVAEATTEQIEKFVSSSVTYNVIRKIKNKSAISREHPKFKMAVGKQYYNRFGTKFDIVGYDGTHFTNHDKHLYDAFGRSSDKGISMYDIIAVDVN